MATSLPKTMAGILVEKTGGTEVLQYRTDLPVPVPKENEVLVKNDVIGINFIDIYFRTGLYVAPKPEILGKEGAGEVAAVGPGVTGFAPSDRVAYLSGNAAYATYTCAPVPKTVKLPPSISTRDAGAALLQGLTAMTLISEAHHVNAGDWVLVLAASGGTGGWLCQLLKARGAHIIATVGSKAKVKVAEEAGADVVVVEGEGDVLEVVKEKTGGQGVRVVFDGVGKETFERSLEAVARKGSLISFGNASGAVEPFAISRLAPKNVKIARPTLFNYIYTREEFDQYTTELFTLMTEKNLNVKIWDTYPLKDVARAHDDLETRKTMGKLLLAP